MTTVREGRCDAMTIDAERCKASGVLFESSGHFYCKKHTPRRDSIGIVLRLFSAVYLVALGCAMIWALGLMFR